LNLVFDLGGVVFRWRPDEFLPRLAPQRATTPEMARRFAADFFQGFHGDWGEFDRGRLEAGPLAERIAARIGIEAGEARALIDAIAKELVPLSDTVALMRRLRGEGHRLFYLSNMPASYAHHLEATHDVFGSFERGVFSSRAGLIKPEPAMFAHAAEVYGCAPAELLLIDDVQTNVDAARACGWRAIRFEDAASCERDLRKLLEPD
jgi:putative hydrolase of the HAD superfamily